MTFLNETSHSLYTVVEKPPLGNINGYKVNLVKAGYGVIQSGKYIEVILQVYHIDHLLNIQTFPEPFYNTNVEKF
jgi:nucleoside phosphorylase